MFKPTIESSKNIRKEAVQFLEEGSKKQVQHKLIPALQLNSTENQIAKKIQKNNNSKSKSSKNLRVYSDRTIFAPYLAERDSIGYMIREKSPDLTECCRSSNISPNHSRMFPTIMGNNENNAAFNQKNVVKNIHKRAVSMHLNMKFEHNKRLQKSVEKKFEIIQQNNIDKNFYNLQKLRKNEQSLYNQLATGNDSEITSQFRLEFNSYTDILAAQKQQQQQIRINNNQNLSNHSQKYKSEEKNKEEILISQEKSKIRSQKHKKSDSYAGYLSNITNNESTSVPQTGSETIEDKFSYKEAPLDKNKRLAMQETHKKNFLKENIESLRSQNTEDEEDLLEQEFEKQNQQHQQFDQSRISTIRKKNFYNIQSERERQKKRNRFNIGQDNLILQQADINYELVKKRVPSLPFKNYSLKNLMTTINNNKKNKQNDYPNQLLLDLSFQEDNFMENSTFNKQKNRQKQKKFKNLNLNTKNPAKDEDNFEKIYHNIMHQVRKDVQYQIKKGLPPPGSPKNSMNSSSGSTTKKQLFQFNFDEQQQKNYLGRDCVIIGARNEEFSAKPVKDFVKGFEKTYNNKLKQAKESINKIKFLTGIYTN